MCFKWEYLCVLLLLSAGSCSSYRKLEQIRSGQVKIGLGVSEDKSLTDDVSEVDIDSIRSNLTDGPIIMNAIRDSETGEMVATDIINASRVVARFRNVAERGGKVSISFDVIVPEGMKDSKYQLKIWPQMVAACDTVGLEPIYITGEKYRSRQLRGYERYRAFLASIVSDTTNFLRMGQLEVFLSRNFPQTYAMRNDTSYVDDVRAESLFGVTQTQAIKHYTRMWQVKMNERRKGKKDRMFARFVRDSLVVEGIRLDTVLAASSGDFIYRYIHEFRPAPKLKKVGIILQGKLYQDGLELTDLPLSDDISFYISSLGTLVEDKIMYKKVVLERQVYDHTKALLDFGQGSATDRKSVV